VASLGSGSAPMRDTVNHFSPLNKTQSAAILRLLIEARGAGVPLPQIMCAGQYSARICELRKQGFRIENRTARQADGARHSWFRLLPGDTRFNPAPTPVPKPPEPAWEDRPRVTGLPLFDLAVKK
jgi:Helix-turn-helix domain